MHVIFAALCGIALANSDETAEEFDAIIERKLGWAVKMNQVGWIRDTYSAEMARRDSVAAAALARLRTRIDDLERLQSEQIGGDIAGSGIAGTAAGSVASASKSGSGGLVVRAVHKHTFATADPLAAATFVAEHMGATLGGPNRHKCGATNTVTFNGTAADPENQFLMHFVFNPNKAPGPVYMNATELGLYEEHLRAQSMRNGSFDQFMDNHIGMLVSSLDPFVEYWQAHGVPFVCRTWCCAEPMAQFPARCPAYSFNRTEGCETGCYIEVPHGIIMELQCGLNSFAESLACLTLVEPEVFNLCSAT